MKEPDAGIAISFTTLRSSDSLRSTSGAAALGTKTKTAEAILEDLYDEYARPLFRYALSILGSSEDAEDAVQDVFIRIALERMRVMRIRNVKAYLFASARNASYTRLRERHRRDELIEAACAGSSEVPADRVEDRLAQSEMLCTAFAELPIEQREVLTLKVFEQMTFDEIARTVGASINTVASRYRYGIAKLKQALEA